MLIEKIFLSVSCDPRGTHALQSFLDCLANPKYYELIIPFVVPATLTLAFNKHGTHVLIKFVQLLDVQALRPIFEVIAANFTSLSQDSNGLPVIKRVLAKFTAADFKAQLVERVASNVIILAQNAYGNYAIQVALDVSFP